MKTKTLLRISIFGTLPVMLSLLMTSMMSFEWLLNDTGHFAEMFLSGNFNRTFSCILFGSGVISMAIMFVTQLGLIKYADKIDRLDEATMEYFEAKRKYEEATRKFVQQIK